MEAAARKQRGAERGARRAGRTGGAGELNSAEVAQTRNRIGGLAAARQQHGGRYPNNSDEGAAQISHA